MKAKLDEVGQVLDEIAAADAELGLELGTGQVQTVRLASLAYATLRGGRVVLALANGQEVQARSSETLVSLTERLKPFPAFIRAHNAYLVNLDLVDTITRTGAGEYALTLAGGAQVPLLQNHQAVKDHFQLKSLDNVVPWNERLAIIIKENLRDFDRDIRMMETADIQRLFADGTGQLVVTQLIGNIAWQAFNWIQAGKTPPIDGNLRSFWYSHIKPVLGRVLPKLDERQYGDMSAVFAKYVGDYHLFRYADFGFVEDSDANRIIGDRHPQVIVLAEKKGHWRTLQKIAAQTGATVISLGGQPSLMATEFFVEALAKATSLDTPLHLITDVDYDPSGQIIAESFRDQLRQMGAKPVAMRHLIAPVNFTADEVKYFKYPVKNDSSSDKTKVKRWLNPDRRKYPDREPAGIVDENGVRQSMGLESDAMPKDRLMELAAAAVASAAAPPGTKERRVAVRGFPYP